MFCLDSKRNDEGLYSNRRRRKTRMSQSATSAADVHSHRFPPSAHGGHHHRHRHPTANRREPPRPSLSPAPPKAAARSTASGRRPSLAVGLRTHAAPGTPRRHRRQPRHASTSTPQAPRPICSLHRWALADHAANREMAGATIKAVVVGYSSGRVGDGERQNRNPPPPSPAPRHGPVGPKGRLG